MQLREAEALGMFDDDDRGFGHIDADFDHRRRDKHLVSPRAKAAIAASRSAPFILPWTRPIARAENLLERGIAFLDGRDVQRLAFGDERADPIGARAVRDRALQARDDIADALERQCSCFDRLTARRLVAQRRDIHVAEIGENERARNRRRRHHQNIGASAFGAERQALMHAEAMLLVDDGEAEIAEADALLKQRMCADDDVDLARGQSRERARARRAVSRPVSKARRRPAAAAYFAAIHNAGGRALRSAPSTPPAGRPRRPRPWRAARQSSCPSRHRLAAAAASAQARQDRGGFRRAHSPARP